MIHLKNSLNKTLNSGINNLNSNLQEVTQDLYFAIRQDPGLVGELYMLVEELISYIMSLDHQDPHIYNRVLSLIAFKNDISLQNNLDEKQVDLYHKEVKNIMEYKGYFYDSFTVPKIGECLGKIQFAYNILGSEKNIRGDFVAFMDEVGKKNLLGDLIDDLNNRGHIDADSPSMLFQYYFLFREDVENKLIESAFHRYMAINLFWKGYKISHYNMTINEIFDEGWESYNFVYR